MKNVNTANPIVRYVDKMRNSKTHTIIAGIYVAITILMTIIALADVVNPQFAVVHAYITLGLLVTSIAYLITFSAIKNRIERFNTAQIVILDVFRKASIMVNQEIPVPATAEDCIRNLNEIRETAFALYTHCGKEYEKLEDSFKTSKDDDTPLNIPPEVQKKLENLKSRKIIAGKVHDGCACAMHYVKTVY